MTHEHDQAHAANPRAPSIRGVPIIWLQLGVLCVFLALSPFLNDVDPDYWWHLSTGDLILESGIPRADPFSWTQAGDEWIAHEWLSEAIFAANNSAFGYVGNVILVDAAVVIGIAVMCVLAKRLGAPDRRVVVMAFLAFLSMGVFLTVRPQTFTWMFFAVFLFVLERHRQAFSPLLWLLPIATILWANLHLGSIAGATLVWVWCVARVVRRTRGENLALLQPIGIAVACTLSPLATPNGLNTWLLPMQLVVSDRDQLRLVSEWNSPLFFVTTYLIPYYVSLILLLAALWRRRRGDPFLLLTGLVVVGMSLGAVRNVPFVALTLIPLAAADVKDLRPRNPTIVRWPVAVAAFVVVAVLSVAVVMRFGTGSLREPSDNGYPEDGLAYVSSLDGRMYNVDEWGGYIIHRSDVPVFIDGRTDLYRGSHFPSSSVIDDYITIGRLEPGWERLMNAYDIRIIFVRKESRLAGAIRLRSDWQEVFTGPIESVFVRR